MDARAYLTQVKALNERLRQTDREIQALREVHASLRSPWPDGQPHGTVKGDPVGNEATKIADQIMELLERQIRIRGRIWAKRAEILLTIDKVGDYRLQRLLHEYYVEDRTLQEVAITMGLTRRQIYRLHTKALDKVREVLHETENMR